MNDDKLQLIDDLLGHANNMLTTARAFNRDLVNVSMEIIDIEPLLCSMWILRDLRDRLADCSAEEQLAVVQRSKGLTQSFMDGFLEARKQWTRTDD